jgi:hypothetical protein
MLHFVAEEAVHESGQRQRPYRDRRVDRVGRCRGEPRMGVTTAASVSRSAPSQPHTRRRSRYGQRGWLTARSAAIPALPDSTGGCCSFDTGCAAASGSAVLHPAQPYSASGSADRVGRCWRIRLLLRCVSSVRIEMSAVPTSYTPQASIRAAPSHLMMAPLTQLRRPAAAAPRAVGQRHRT